MKLTIVDINSNGSDSALFLGANLIISCDPSIGEDHQVLDTVAKNLSRSLSMDIVEITHSPLADWNWGYVTDELIKAGKLPQRDTAGSTTLLNTTIQDWRIIEQCSTDDLPPEHLGSYSLVIEKINETNQIFLSVHDSKFNESTCNVPKFGLSTLIEIRNGLPTISVGISPDANIIDIVSNTSGKLAVVPTYSKDRPRWSNINFSEGGEIESSMFGICFENYDFGLLTEARGYIANDTFEQFDLDGFLVEDEQAWEVNDAKWTKAFSGRKDEGSDEIIEMTFFINYKKDGTHILSCGYN